MKKMLFKKLNNQGSTFVLAVVVIALVTILAASIMMASAHNIAMKNVDRNSKVTFYTAESVLDELRAGVGLDCMTYLGKSYEDVLTTIVQEDALGYSYIVDNETANRNFKSKFVDNMLGRISSNALFFTGTNQELLSMDINVKQHVISYLQGFLKGYDAGMAKVLSIGNIEAYKESTSGLQYLLIIRDVAVEYKEKRSGETYFANVTADLEMEFPNMTVDFSSSNRISNFTDYSLIADDNLNIQDCTVNVQSSIYAGNEIQVAHKPEGTGSTSTLNVDGILNRVNVVCGGNTDGGNIYVAGNADYKSYFNASNADIWCANLVTKSFLQDGKDVTSGAQIQLDSLCRAFVKDDLSAEGKNSIIDLNGEYYGYSYDGYEASSLHLASSAIIINGKQAKINIGTSKMILGGHAYVEVAGGDSDYMTGEALSFKGDQEVYLIPAKYLGINHEIHVPNPMPVAMWEELVAASEAEGSKVKLYDVSNFFAKKQGYLAEVPYKAIKAANGLVYVYINFKDKASAKNYVYDVANKRNGADASLTQALNKYTDNLFGNVGYVKITGDEAAIYTKGALLVTGGSTAGTANGTSSSTVGDMSYASGTATMSNDEFVLTSMDLRNRYEILSHLMVSIPWVDIDNASKKYIVNDIDAALWQKANYLLTGNELTSADIFELIIDESWLGSNPYNETGTYIQYGEAGINYTKIAIDGNYIVPDDCRGGIIVATGTVTLDHDFHGMIIAGKNIVINDGATITTNATMIEYLITTEMGFSDEDQEENVPFREYFYAYKHSATEDNSREEVKVETVDYKDLVNFNNWRKYED